MRTVGGPLTDGLRAGAEDWLRNGVGCQAGRAELRRGRYVLARADGPRQLAAVRHDFGVELRGGDAVACLVMLEPENPDLAALTVEKLSRYLEERYFPEAGTDGGADHRLHYRLPCPVTGLEVDFGDFEQVAYYPQATDEADAGYDPSRAAPWVCVNVTSNVYGFSMLAADVHRRGSHSGRPIGELAAEQRAALYATALRMFQHLAESTVRDYGEATNAELLCPVHVTEDRRYFVAQHEGSAFVSTSRRAHRAELPVVWAQRVIEQWEGYFERAVVPDMSGVYSPPVAL